MLEIAAGVFIGWLAIQLLGLIISIILGGMD